MKVIIAGSRHLTDHYQTVCMAVEVSGWDVTEVVCGMAKGIDALGKEWGLRNGVYVADFPADWNKYGKSAGHRRNEQMALYADSLILIWDGVSRGSANMYENAKKRGLPIFEVQV